MSKRFRLTSHRPDNTTTLHTAGADNEIQVAHLIDTMRKFSPGLFVTVEDTETGIVYTKRT